MSYTDDNAPHSDAKPQSGIQMLGPAGDETKGTAIPTDRLYQIAAMMAGIFLLATIL